MPFSIEWVESCTGPEQGVKIKLPVGLMSLTMRGDVITGSDWELDVENEETGNHPLQQAFDMLWLKHDHVVHIKLLRQGSNYRNRVWAELCKIPFGKTVSYSDLAKAIGSAARAVGNACRDNPYAFIIPCHRVVSIGGIGGYCGQNDGLFLEIKTRLLQFESAI